MYSDEISERHRLQPGCALSLMLPAGSEIYCLQGTARIVPAPQMLADTLNTATLALRTGQAWRSEQARGITVRNDGHEPCTIKRVQPASAFAEAPKENRLAALATRRFQEALLWIRRGPSAASMKSP